MPAQICHRSKKYRIQTAYFIIQGLSLHQVHCDILFLNKEKNAVLLWNSIAITHYWGRHIPAILSIQTFSMTPFLGHHTGTYIGFPENYNVWFRIEPAIVP